MLRVFYHGSIGPARLPLSIVDALALLPSGVTLDIAGYETAGHTGHLDRLGRRAAELGIGDRVRVLGPVPLRRELLRLCTACDVGLSLLPRSTGDVNEAAMFGASNKVFDYLACGLPALVTDLPAWRNALVPAGFALACDAGSATSIASALRWFLEHPDETAAMGQRGRDRILSDWNYERAFAPVLSRIVPGAVPDRPRVPEPARA
jgi:glycosyltransferase involved in cell wall biosynthesis